MRTAGHPGDDRLLDLVNGLVPDGERVEVLEHLRRCASCASLLREFAGAHERAHVREPDALHPGSRIPLSGGVVPPAARRVLPFLRPAHPAGHALPHPADRRHPGGARRLALAAAGLIVVLGAAATLWNAPWRETRRAVAIAWLPAPEPSTVIRDFAVTPRDPRVAQGLAAYRLHDARTARRLLEAAKADGPMEAVRRVYLGNAELQLGDSRAAIETLREVDLRRVPEPWRGETQWSLGSAFARAGRSREADSLWRLLSTRADEIGDRARGALGEPGAASGGR